MPETSAQEKVLFEETQQTSPATSLFVVLAGGGAIVGAALFASSRGELTSALPGLLIGTAVIGGVTLMIGATRLRSRVTTAEATFVYGRFGSVRLLPGDIGTVEMTRFGMFNGGVGYHIAPKSVAITARTGDGVLVRRPDGRRVLIGTEHPEALYSALLRLQAAAKSGF